MPREYQSGSENGIDALNEAIFFFFFLGLPNRVKCRPRTFIRIMEDALAPEDGTITRPYVFYRTLLRVA